MDRCALFVDAGYVLADGAMAVHGTRRRESVSWDYAGLLGLLGELATEQSKLPLLRCYWYEATVEGRRSADHDTLADLPGVKLRVAKMRPGHREGVEGEIHRDLTTLARNKAVSDVMLVSAEEDLAQVIADVQDMGMRVTLLHITADGDRAVPPALRQESDDIVEIGASQLRPFVELISGAEPPRPDETEEAVPAAASGSLSGAPYNGNGHAAAPGQAAYAQSRSPGQPVPGQQPAAGLRPVTAEFQPAAEFQPVSESQQPSEVFAEQPDQPGPQAADAGQPEPGQSEPAAADYPPMADLAASADYSSSVDYGAAEQRPAAAEYGSAPDYGTVPDYQGPDYQRTDYQRPNYGEADYRGADYGMPDYAAPVASALPREDRYAAPAAVSAADERQGERDRLPVPARPGADYSGYTPGGVRDQYQRDGRFRESEGGEASDRLQPVPVALPGGSAQVRRMPTRGPLSAGPNPGLPGPGLPPALAPGLSGPLTAPPALPQPGLAPVAPELGGPQPGGMPSAGYLSTGPVTGSQPAVPVAPVVSLDANGAGYAASRGASYGGPRPVFPGEPAGFAGPGGGGPGGPGGPGSPGGFGGPAGPSGPGPVAVPAGRPGFGPAAPSSQPLPPAPPAPGGQPDLSGPAGPSGPIGLVGPGGYPGGTPGASLTDAVQSAHEEGQAFGESVARDAPALWLEAVLARKPRMPSDLEARLLQGSALPIDFLLHDEVRFALRRGFWDALERSRR